MCINANATPHLHHSKRSKIHNVTSGLQHNTAIYECAYYLLNLQCRSPTHSLAMTAQGCMHRILNFELTQYEFKVCTKWSIFCREGHVCVMGVYPTSNLENKFCRTFACGQSAGSQKFCTTWYLVKVLKGLIH